jgi:hypothetical protein
VLYCVVSKRRASSVHKTVCVGKTLQSAVQNCTARPGEISGVAFGLAGRE